MSQGPSPVGAGVVGELHCWLTEPWHVQRMILVPLAVAAPLASRHRPDWTPVILPSAVTVHCWLAWPLQSQTMTAVPVAVPCPKASRHLSPKTDNCRPAVYVHVWFAAPVQSHSRTWAPLPVPAASRQRPDW